MVFQSYALYPHMTVYNNMAFGMKLAKAKKEEIDKQVRAAAEILQLTDYLDRLPKQLSGGQRQRVAIGRAIVRNPRVFLFDEPLSNLDAALRVSMRIEIAKLHERMNDVTMIYVTHDQVEAMTLADRIVVLRAGIIEQVGSPMELYNRPGQPVRRRLHRLARHEHGALHRSRLATARRACGPRSTQPVAVTAEDPGERRGQEGHARRPPGEPVARQRQGTSRSSHGRLDIVEHLGELTLLYVDCGYERADHRQARRQRRARSATAEVALAAPAEMLHVFDDKGQAFPRA